MIQAFLRPLLAITCVIGSYAQAATLQGTAIYRERIAAPADAIFEASLQKIQTDGTAGPAVGHAALNPAGQTPFKFEIVYDAAIQPGQQYRVSTVLSAQGRVLFSGATPVTLPQADSKPIMILMRKGAPEHVGAPAASTVAPAASQDPAKATAKPDSPLRNTYWKLVTLHGKAVTAHEQQREAHIVFSASDDRLSGSSGCNRMMGGFEEKGDQLKLKQVAGTMMACPQGMAVETAFLNALLTVARYKISAEHLDMLDASGNIVAGFDAVALQ
jgi:putative lipoprotein